LQNELLLGEDLELELSGEDQSAQTIVHDWPCNCLLCRVFVRPMFGVLTKILERKLEGVEAESRQELESKAEEGVEGFVKKVRRAGVEVKAVSISKSQGEDESEGEVTEEVGKDIFESAGEPKDLGKIPELAGIIERIEALENEVQALKTGVASTIEGIKSTLVDLRAAVAEVSNPFNIMRKYAELLGLSTQQVQAAQPVQQVARPPQITTPVSSGDALLMMQQLRKHEHETGAYEEEKDVKEIDIDEDRIESEKQQGSKEERSSEESSISLEDVLSLGLTKDKEGSGRGSLRHSSEKKEEEKHEGLGGGVDEMEEFTPLTLESLVTSKSAKKLGLGRLIKLVKWIDAILERMPEDSLEDIVKFATNIGILTRDDADLILKALALVIKTREGGLRIDDQLIALYMLAKIFGIEDKEADGEVVKLAVNRDDLLDRFIKP